MPEKPSLSFYTNIPTPYQLSFFKALSELFRLRVIYYSSTENNRSWNFSFRENYEVTVLKNNIIGRFFQKWVTDFHFSWKIFGTAAKDKSDFVIVMGNYWTPNAAATLVISKVRSKKVYYFSEPILQVNNVFKYSVKWIFLRLLNICCHSIICIGKNATESFNRYGITRPKYEVPYNIDIKPFTDLDPDKVAAFKERYKASGEIIILSSGALIHRKGMDILINAVREISNPLLKLIIIGDGPQKQELMQICGTDNRIVFAGFQQAEAIPYFYAISDIFAFASRYDGWAVVINEAIAANVPIISSDKVGAAVDLIGSSRMGILCKSESVTEFKQAIERLATDKTIRTEIKRNTLGLIPLISSDYNAKRVRDVFFNVSG